MRTYISILLLLAGVATASDPLTAAARDFLDALPDDERSRASFPFHDEERTDIHYAPFNIDGARHGDLGETTYALGDALLAEVLSPRGLETVRAIRLLERDVREGESIFMRALGFRDPGRYFWAFFGQPSEAERWGFRYEGHHVSLNVSRLPGHPAAVTPLFLGAQPRVVPPGMPSAGVAALGEEERLARSLYASLDAAERDAATLDYVADRGHMIGQVARAPIHTPVGVARAALDEAQRAMLDTLLGRFTGLWRPDIAAARQADVERAREGLRFAHVESESPPFAFYTRVSGPGVLLEIDNTEDGDHVHAVWHLPGGDFGDDLLAKHLADDHGIVLARRVD